MLEEYNFELDRTRGTMAVMNLVPTFRPDDKDPAAVQGLIDAAVLVRDDIYLTRYTERNQMDAQSHAAVEALHKANVAVHGAMRSRYRDDKVSLESIEKVPVQDRTPGETRQRATILLKTWLLLPLPANAPVQAGPPPHFYIPYSGMDTTAFALLQTAVSNGEATTKTTDANWEKAEAQLHGQQRLLHDFNVAAGAQGRAQFPDPASLEAELIDSIPSEPPVSAPGTAVITEALATGPGSARLKVSCARASRFDWEKLTAPDTWAPYQADVPLSILIVTGLSAGPHTFRVQGQNSRGESEWSEPVEITVQ